MAAANEIKCSRDAQNVIFFTRYLSILYSKNAAKAKAKLTPNLSVRVQNFNAKL